jgi:hypothetical protein
MTLPNTFTAGTDALAAEVNEDFVYVNPVFDVEHISAVEFSGVIAHSATNYSLVQTAGNVGLWNGTTFTAKSANLGTISILRLCKANAAYGVGVEGANSGKVIFTSSSGATWATETATGFLTKVYDASMPTTSLVVVGGDDAGGVDHVVFSTDLSEGGGGSWTDATTSPGAGVYCIDMFDGTTGYTVDSAGNIWKTTDSAVTWVDTNDNVTGIVFQSSILCLDADTCIIVCDDGRIYHYVNSTNTVTLKHYNADYDLNNGIINTNGILYIMMRNTTTASVILLTSNDSGVTWTSQSIGYELSTATTTEQKCGLAPYDTGKIMFPFYGTLLKQDRSLL